jgi:hypothetical protein
MNFERLYNFASIRPNIDTTIFVSRVAPALFIEVSTGDLLLFELLEDSLLLELLGHISGVPEVDLLGRPGCKSEVVGSLGPLDAHHGVFRALHVQQLLLSLNIVNGHVVVVVLVNTGYISTAGAQGH